ncbi:hypothetical protein [Thauera humireducens]|uniref:phage fiber-tail adaptor protein n=1 Tax=Thauera humireducens TaxID=1134435 RepID=UPI00311F468C
MTRTAFILRSDGTLAVHQRAEDRLAYGIDYAGLIEDGDAIASSEWTKSGSVTTSGGQVDGTVASVVVSGTGGSVTNAIETTNGMRKAITFCVLPAPVSAC